MIADRYTILLALLIIGIVGYGAWRINEAGDCESTGGQYAQTWRGYECVGGQK